MMSQLRDTCISQHRCIVNKKYHFWVYRCSRPKSGLGSSCRQFLKCQRVSSNHVAQRVKEQIGALAAVEAESHFVKVRLQMFRTDLVPRSDDTTLEQGESGLDAVCVDVGSKPDVLSCAVIDSFVLEIAYSFRIGAEIVGYDNIHVLRDVLLDVPCESPTFGVLGMEEPQITVALANADDAFLVVSPIHPLATALHSAYVSFVHFDSTIEYRAVNLRHCLADTVTEIPCGFVRPFVKTPDSTLELMGAHAFLGFAQEECGKEPYRQRQVRVMEDRATCNRELILATHAFVPGIVFQARHSGIFATGAHHAFGPAQPLKQLAAAVIGGIHLIHFGESHGSTS